MRGHRLFATAFSFALVSAFSLVGSTFADAQGECPTQLWGGAEIVEPSADIPENLRRWSGLYGGGKWGGTRCNSLAVLQVNKDGSVRVQYGRGRAPGNNPQFDYSSHLAQINGDTLTLTFSVSGRRVGEASYTMARTGLDGLFWEPSGTYGTRLTRHEVASTSPSPTQATTTAKSLHDEGWRYVNGIGVTIGVPNGPAQGVALIRQAAEQGYAPSQGVLAWFYRDGLHGLPKSDADALKWGTEAFNNGFTNAGSELGVLYRDGRGVPKDAAKAAKFFEDCANGGGTNWCARNLGLLYRDGNGVPQDKAKAKEWLRKAAAAGNKTAEQDLVKLD